MESSDESGARTRRLNRAEYYVDLGIVVTSGMLAGMALVAEHSALDDPLARGVVAGFFALMAIYCVGSARKNWLRSHGVTPIAVEMNAVKEDWSNE